MIKWGKTIQNVLPASAQNWCIMGIKMRESWEKKHKKKSKESFTLKLALYFKILILNGPIRSYQIQLKLESSDLIGRSLTVWLQTGSCLFLFIFYQSSTFLSEPPRFITAAQQRVCVCVLSQLRHSLSTRLQSMQGEESSEEEEEDEACSWSSLPVLR